MTKKTESALKILAPAKVNFSLEVLSKRSDGFHEVRMLLAGINLMDELEFESWPECVLECDLPNLDCGPSNLIMKAARLMQKESGENPGARIRLKKRIPLGAGLAGGSTDAAATLKGLNRLWKLGLSGKRLETLGAKLGSDVPFCLESGWAIATGRGEKLKRFDQRKSFALLLLNPGFEVSTKWAYQNVLPRSGSTRNFSKVTYEALDRKDFEQLDKSSVNDLEAVTAAEHPEIGKMRQELSEEGALLSRMSGSGPSVWALFKDETSAKKAEKSFKNRYKFVSHVQTISKI